jgi:hypothetical protein
MRALSLSLPLWGFTLLSLANIPLFSRTPFAVRADSSADDIHLDIDVSSLHDADHHLEKKYHDDVHIKFVDLHDNILCDAKMSRAADETIPCVVDRNLLRAGKNPIHAKVYLVSTGETIEHFDLTFNLGDIPGFENKNRLGYMLLGGVVTVGGVAILRDRHQKRDSIAIREDKLEHITSSLNLNEFDDSKNTEDKKELGGSSDTTAAAASAGGTAKKLEPKRDPFTLKSSFTYLKSPKFRRTAISAGVVGGSLLGAFLMKPRKKQHKIDDTIVDTEMKAEMKEPEVNWKNKEFWRKHLVKVIGAAVTSTLLLPAGIAYAIITKRKPPPPPRPQM